MSSKKLNNLMKLWDCKNKVQRSTNNKTENNIDNRGSKRNI